MIKLGIRKQEDLGDHFRLLRHVWTLGYPITTNGFMRHHLWATALMLTMVLSSCGVESGDGADGSADSGEMDQAAGPRFDENGCEILNSSTLLQVNGLQVRLRNPSQKPIGDLLLLPPWDETGEIWTTETRLCAKAVEKGYRVIMPDMGKSIYSMEVYPETRPDWRVEPTFRFLSDTLIEALRDRFCLLETSGQNFAIGVGSGARGVVRLLEEFPDLFAAAAALSGDYDPSLAPRDNVYRGFLGEHESNSGRWKEAENLCHFVEKIKTPLWLSHGQDDDYVPYTQTELLFNVLRNRNANLQIQFNLSPGQGHGFSFWNTEISDIFHFFETAASARPEAP